MDEQKLASIFSSVYDQTRNRKIEWIAGGEKDAFETTLPGFKMRLYPNVFGIVCLWIYNKDEALLATIDSIVLQRVGLAGDVNQALTTLTTLHQMARDHVLKVDQSLDQLLKQLDRNLRD